MHSICEYVSVKIQTTIININYCSHNEARWTKLRHGGHGCPERPSSQVLLL